MISKYLQDIGVQEKDVPCHWNPDDIRQEQWKEEQEIYGFDERETWNFDYSFYLWAYPRLKMYCEVNIIDTGFYTFEYEGKTYTMQECIDKILDGFKLYLTDSDKIFADEVKQNRIRDARMLFSIILPVLWW